MQFKNVTTIKKANVYFDGKVTSRTIILQSGEKKTLGFMLAGDYNFSTGAAEIMEVLGGKAEVMLNGESSFKVYEAGSSFSIPKNSGFTIKVAEYLDYCCSYIEE